MNAVVAKAFSIYQQIPSPAPRVKWGNIMGEICFTKGWFGGKGNKSTVVYG